MKILIAENETKSGRHDLIPSEPGGWQVVPECIQRKQFYD